MEERRCVYDDKLKIEAYQFVGLMQKFPNHFHEHFVIGFIEKGTRHLSCLHNEYVIHQGDLMLFNPKDNHTCKQIDNHTLDYRCLNIPKDVMQNTVMEISGKRKTSIYIYMVPVITVTTSVLILSEKINLIYASNEENALLAEVFDEYRDNERNSQSVFLLVSAIGILFTLTGLFLSNKKYN